MRSLCFSSCKGEYVQNRILILNDINLVNRLLQCKSFINNFLRQMFPLVVVWLGAYGAYGCFAGVCLICIPFSALVIPESIPNIKRNKNNGA